MVINTVVTEYNVPSFSCVKSVAESGNNDLMEKIVGEKTLWLVSVNEKQQTEHKTSFDVNCVYTNFIENTETRKDYKDIMYILLLERKGKKIDITRLHITFYTEFNNRFVYSFYVCFFEFYIVAFFFFFLKRT